MSETDAHVASSGCINYGCFFEITVFSIIRIFQLFPNAVNFVSPHFNSLIRDIAHRFSTTLIIFSIISTHCIPFSALFHSFLLSFFFFCTTISALHRLSLKNCPSMFTNRFGTRLSITGSTLKCFMVTTCNTLAMACIITWNIYYRYYYLN